MPKGIDGDIVVAPSDEDLDEEERAALHAAIGAAEAELDAGQVVTEEELRARLRAIP